MRLAQAKISTKNFSHDTDTITDGLPALLHLVLLREPSSPEEKIFIQGGKYILGSQESFYQGAIILETPDWKSDLV